MLWIEHMRPECLVLRRSVPGVRQARRKLLHRKPLHGHEDRLLVVHLSHVRRSGRAVLQRQRLRRRRLLRQRHVRRGE
jgi:hypothetical protein